MANPRISSDIEFVNAERAFSRVQDLVSRKPIKIQLAADAKGLDSIDKGLGRLSGRADEFSKSLEAANARVLAFGASVSVITAIEVAFKKLITTTISVEAAFKKIEVVGDQFASTAGQLEKFGRGIFDVARQTGQSFDVTATAALEFARQGLSAAETLKRVKDALTLTRLSGLDATSSVEGLTAAVNAFRKEGLTTTDVINKLIAVDNKYAVSSADLIEAIKRSGSFAQDAGTSFDELAATVTVLQEVTARGGSVIGNSLKTIFERVRRPESIIQLQNLGVEVRGVKGEMLPAIKIIDNFSKKLNSLSDTERQGALRQLAGTFQINQLSALVGVLGEAEGAAKRYDDVLATAANASIEASIANQKLNESLDSQVKSVLASATEFGAAFGNLSIAPLLKDVLKDSGDIFGVLTDSLQSEGPSIGKAFAKVFGDALAVGLAAGTLIVSRFIINFVKFAKESFSTVLRLNDASKNQEGLQLSVLNLLRSRSDVEQAILSAGNNQVAQAKVLRDLYNEMAVTEARRLSISNAVSKNLSASGFVVGSTGLPTPRGKGGRAADGYVPNLVQAEYKDVMKGVGGANKNSKIISLENFPFSGGKKGTMVVNSSEGIMPLGNGGAAVLTKDMMGRRAAGGNVPSLSLESTTVAAKSGKFISVKKLEKVVEETARTLSEQNVVGIKFTNAITKAIKDAEFDLTGKSLREIGTTALSFSKELKTYEQAVKQAYEDQLRINAEKRKAAVLESKRVSDIKSRASNISDPLSRAAVLGQIGYSNTNFSSSRTNLSDPKNNPLALSRSVTSLGGREISNPLGSYQPVRGSAKASDSLSRAIQIGVERQLEELAKSPRGFSSLGNELPNIREREARASRGGEYEIRNRLEKLRIEDLKKEIRSRLNSNIGPGDKLRTIDGAAQKAYIEKLKSGFLTNNKILDNLNVGIGQYKKRLAEIQGTSRTPGLISSARGPEKAKLDAEKAALIANLKTSENRKSAITFRREKARSLLNFYGETIPSPSSTVVSAQQKAQQDALKARLSAKFGGGTSGSGSSVFSGNRPPLQSEIDARKKFEKENSLSSRIKSTDAAEFASNLKSAGKSASTALLEFGQQTAGIFIASSALKEGLSLLGVESTKLVDNFSNAAIAVQAFRKFGELGKDDKNKGSLLESVLGKDFTKAFRAGRRGGSIPQGVLDSARQSRFTSVGLAAGRGISSLSSGVLKLLPVIGQVTSAFFVAKEVLEAFGVDVGGIIYKAFGGISEEAKKLKEGFKELSEAAYQNGKFIGVSSDEINRKTKELDTFAQIQAEASRRGIKTDGKTREQLIDESFAKQMEDVLKSVQTGRTQTFTGFSGTGVSRETVGETFFDLPKEVRSRIEPILQGVLLAPLEDLRKTAGQQLGLSGTDLQKLGLEELQTAIFEAMLKKLAEDVKNVPFSGTEKIFQNESTTRSLAQLRARFTQGGKTALPEAQNGTRLPVVAGGNIESQIRAAVELKKLQTDFSTLSERELQTKLRTSQLDEVQKTILQNQLTLLEQERDVRSKILAVAEDGLNKFASIEEVKSGEILVKDFEKAVEVIKSLGGSAEATKQKLQEFFGRTNFDGFANVEALQKSLFEQIDGQKKLSEERKKQIEQTNQQLLLEARINESLRLRQSLIQSRGELTTSRLESQKSLIEGRSSVLSAQSGNPNLSIGAQNSLKREQINLDIQSLEVQKRIAEEKRKTDTESLSSRSGLNTIERGLELQKINEEFGRSTQSINDQTKALQIQAEQVGLVTSYYTSLAKSIEQFYLGLGELEGTNAFNILQSGDLSSLLSGLSGKQALSDFKSSGKGGEEGIQFYTERLNIRQKESEIIAVQTEAQKIQLEQEKKLLEDIFRIKKEGGTAEEQITKLIEAQNSRLKEQRSIRSGVRSAQAQLQDETNQFGATFGETATLGFRDAISEAMKAAANNTGDLKNALLDVALSFANKLRDAALDNLANIITNGVTGGGSGGGGGIVSGLLGLFSKKATGGKVTGGSGNKDDVPTLLMGGEYVVNKKSVQKYGPQFFEALNQGRIGGMATGGMFDPSYSGKAISGSGNLKKFASQSFTSGDKDKILNLGAGAGSVELEPESQRLTAFGRENSPLFQATQGAKEQALGLVFEDQRLQQQYKDSIKARDKAEKEKLNQLYLSLALAAVGAGASSLGGGTPGGTGSLYGKDSLPTYDKNLNYIGSTANVASRSSRAVVRSASSASNISAGTVRAANNANLPIGGFDINKYSNPLFNYRAAGGPVNGNGHGDNVPAMLTGGEFVLNRRASKKLGFSNLSAANTGQSLGTSEETSKELNDRVVTKLDELIQTISSTGGGVNVNVQMDGQGKTQSNEAGDQNETQKNLNRRIKDAVVAVLQEEKRLGGVLR